MVASDHLESKPNLLPVAEEAFAAITEALSTFNASCERALDGARSLSFEQVEHVALQTATVLAALRGYQNTLLPVSKLPPELLTRVFEFAASPSTIDNYRQFQSQHSELADPVVNLARVCSSWRAIALASPQLWYHIIDTDTASFQPKLFLQRSCTSDIHVYVSLPDGLLLKTHSIWPDIVRSHAHRVRELHLFINRVTTMQDLLDSISVPLPSLEFLTMSAGGNDTGPKHPFHPGQLVSESHQPPALWYRVWCGGHHHHTPRPPLQLSPCGDL
ncbi:hypothetical protein LXA43DRAFT_435557 [Ganoderma leucocontextum]|nr:hypothetical protein LXA43DRAFT_435557 [Ganoderma leucocontextum]